MANQITKGCNLRSSKANRSITVHNVTEKWIVYNYTNQVGIYPPVKIGIKQANKWLAEGSWIVKK